MPLFSSNSEGVWARAMRQENFAAILDWFSRYFFGCGIAILLVVDVVASTNSSTPYHTAALSAAGGLMLAAAAVVAGWVLGLLFGIPRSLSRPQPTSGQPLSAGGAIPNDKDHARSSRTNTNLEDVSDWLTKTIIGLGLANIYLIPGYAWRKSGQIGAQIFSSDESGQSFVLLITVYFAVGGFWIGYVGTRTMITLLFDDVDRSKAKAVAEAANPQNLQIDQTTRTIKPATDGLLEADTQLLGRPLQTMNSATELAAWAAAKARSGDWGTALAVLGEAAKTAPGNAAIKSLLATVSSAKPDPEAKPDTSSSM